MKKKSTAFVASLFGAASLLITLGAGCAGQTGTIPNVPASQVPVSLPPSAEPQPPIPTPAPTPEPPVPTPTPEPTPAPVTTPPPTPKPGKTSYKNGTYSAKGDYTYHSGSEQITISLTLKDDIVTDTTFQAVPSVPMSGKFQKMFSDNYKPMVIGKNIGEVCGLDKVSGSSLTPKGFNDACLKIQAQAKA
jgi:hypothetical protein